MTTVPCSQPRESRHTTAQDAVDAYAVRSQRGAPRSEPLGFAGGLRAALRRIRKAQREPSGTLVREPHDSSAPILRIQTPLHQADLSQRREHARHDRSRHAQPMCQLSLRQGLLTNQEHQVDPLRREPRPRCKCASTGPRKQREALQIQSHALRKARTTPSERLGGFEKWVACYSLSKQGDTPRWGGRWGR